MLIQFWAENHSGDSVNTNGLLTLLGKATKFCACCYIALGEFSFNSMKMFLFIHCIMIALMSVCLLSQYLSENDDLDLYFYDFGHWKTCKWSLKH